MGCRCFFFPLFISGSLGFTLVMAIIGTLFTATATKKIFCGSDEVGKALAEPVTQLGRLGKPEVAGGRRLAVGLARRWDFDQARVQVREGIAGWETSL